MAHCTSASNLNWEQWFSSFFSLQKGAFLSFGHHESKRTPPFISTPTCTLLPRLYWLLSIFLKFYMCSHLCHWLQAHYRESTLKALKQFPWQSLWAASFACISLSCCSSMSLWLLPPLRAPSKLSTSALWLSTTQIFNGYWNPSGKDMFKTSHFPLQDRDQQEQGCVTEREFTQMCDHLQEITTSAPSGILHILSVHFFFSCTKTLWKMPNHSRKITENFMQAACNATGRAGNISSLVRNSGENDGTVQMTLASNKSLKSLGQKRVPFAWSRFSFGLQIRWSRELN